MRFGKQKQQTFRQRPVRSRAGGQTFSYYNTLSENRSNKVAEKTIDLSSAGRKVRLLPTIIAIMVIVGSILFSFTLSARPNVSTLEDEASPYRELDEYANAAEALMNGNLGNKTKLTVNTDMIEQGLLEQFPELNAAVLRLPVLGRKPNLIVDIKPPTLLLATSSKSFVLDRSGTVVSEARQLPLEARKNLLVLKDQSGLEIQIGRQALTTETVGFILNAVAQLSAKDLKISELTLPASANQLDIRLEDLRYYIKTDASGDARLQIGSFLAVKEDLEEKGITPASYIDVRVEEKVFYK